MNINRTVIYLLMSIGIGLCSCVKRDLEKRGQEGEVVISLDWKQQTLPSEVCYLFYNQSGNLVKQVVGSSKGITEKLPPGTYHVIAYGRDARRVDYRGLESHNTAEVFAHTKGTNAKNTNAKSTTNYIQILQPQDVFGVSSCQGIGELVVEQGTTLHRTAEPKSLTKQVKFRFTIINASQISQLSGMLTGIAPSVMLSTGKSIFTQAGVTFFDGFEIFANLEGNYNTYFADITVFNLLASEQSLPQTNTIEISLEANGKRHVFTTDLTQVLGEIIKENGGAIPIEIPIEMEITVKDAELGATAKVKPWVHSGMGDNTVE